MLFGKPSSVEYIIVGLGNPGRKYEGTRHNAGFAALDHAAAAWGIEVNKAKFDALTGTGTVAGHKVLLMKPQTFMNASGVAVQKAAAFYKADAAHVLVLFDDISLAPGVLRLREKGSAIRDVLDSTLLLSGHSVCPLWVSVNSPALMEAAKAGLGITVLPDLLLKDELEKGALIPLDIKGLSLENELFAVWHRDKFLSAPLHALLSCIAPV